MTFVYLSDGLWHGHYSYMGQILTFKANNIVACVIGLGSQLNTLKSAEVTA